jgi:protein-S-isoprenylcysteine O-methyltransferase Ste14
VNPRNASLGATVVLVIATVSLFTRHGLFATGAPLVAGQVAAGLLMLWARLTFGVRSFHAGANPTEGGIVTRGPYRFVRHPIYAAILLFVWAGIASHVDAINLGLGAGITLAIAARIATEERLLGETYPEYREYAARTPRVIPFVL